MMIALAMIFSYVETMIPINFGIPGVKLGLANLVIVAAIYLFGGKQALFDFHCANLLKRIHDLEIWHPSCTVWRAVCSVWQSCSFCKKTDKLSILAVSVMGGICHNIGQLIVAMLVVENLKLNFLCSGTSDFRISYRSADRYRMQSDSSSSQTGIRICKITSCLPGA